MGAITELLQAARGKKPIYQGGNTGSILQDCHMRIYLEHHVQVTKIQERLVDSETDERASKLQKRVESLTNRTRSWLLQPSRIKAVQLP